MDARRTASLAVLAGLVGLGTATVYSGVASALAALAESDQYSYLAVVAGVLGAALAAGASRGSGGRLTPSRLLAALALLAAASLLYTLASLGEEYRVQYASASLAAYLAAVAVLVVDAPPALAIVALAAAAALIPPPQHIVDAAAVHLSRYVGAVVARMTGAEYVETASRALLLVETPQGRRTLEVAVACSGIVSLSTVAASVPAVGLYAVYSRASRARKAAAITAAASIAAVVAFLGNVLRVYAIVRAAEAHGIEESLKVFHGTPTLVYVPVSVAAALAVAYKLLGPPAEPPRVPLASWRAAAAAWVAALVLAGSFVAVLSAARPPSPQEGPGAVPIEELLRDPAGVVLRGTGARVVLERDVGALTILTGASIVKMVAVDYAGARFYGYVEVADTPVRFHSWRECLVYQGYRVTATWSVERGGVTVRFAEGVKGGLWTLVGYAIYSVPVDTGAGVEEAYVKLSLLVTRPGGMEDPAAATVIASILSSVKTPQAAATNPTAYLAASTGFTAAALLAGLAYTLAAAASRAARRKAL